ncbi:MFS transporter [Phenylobacterium sp.]|uniref:MFS transporter n=1 Tax=Phenylobacterium sp. TaxID=1871053 RepID=UPI0035B2B9D6
MTTAATPAKGGLRQSTKLFYGFGSVAFGVKDQGFSYLLLIFYNQVVGLSSEVVGLAIMIALVFDAFLDPIVGQLSDNWRSRWGRRHPFMYAAALPVTLSYLLIWNPPAWSHQALFFYLIVTAVMIRSFITLYEIPSTAMAAELTTEYDERTTVLSYRYFFGWVGGLTMTLAAFQIFLKPDAAHKVGQLNPAGYSHYGLAAALVMLTAILVSAIGTHREIPNLREPPHRKLTARQFLGEMAATLAHKSFLTILMSALFTAMAAGLVLSLNLYLNTYFWQLSAKQISLFVLGNFGSAALAFIFAAPLGKRFGKKPAAIALKISAFVIGSAPIVLRLIGAFPPNGHPAVVPILFAQTIVSTALSIMSAILLSSMIADVVEDSELRTGRRSEGLFFSAAAFVNKAVSGVGIFTASLILLAVGFPRNADPSTVSAEVVRNLGLVYVPVLGGLYIVAILFLLGYRITRQSHEDSLRKLAAAADRVEEQASPDTAA